MFAALIVLGTFIKIPVPVVPFTLQFFFTTSAGLLLGSRDGAFSVMIYILLGLCGLPVFANGGGISYVLQPSFGYMPGFMLGAFATGMIAERSQKPSYTRLVIANLTGLLIVYGVGLLYYALISDVYLGTPVGLWPLFLYGFVLAVPGDIVLCTASAAIAVVMLPHIRSRA